MTKAPRIALGVAFLAVISFYYWTAATSDGIPPPGRGIYSDYYNLLAHGFLKGHLSLDVAADPAMLAARDPYDPAVWSAHGGMLDTSYYRGKYYLYFGAAPALVFLLPYRLLTGGDLWLGTAGSLAATLAFCALAGLWLRIRRDYFPRSGGAMALGAVLALGGASGLLAAVRRPYIYEFPIASGCLFATLMLHSLYSAIGSRRKGAWMTAAGLCLGLAVASRPTLLFAILAPGWVIAYQKWRDGKSAALGFALGFGAIFAATLFYNYERFGNFLEFGFRYQLSTVPASKESMLSPANVWFNFRLYYTAGLAWSRHFPFATIIAPAGRPKIYYLSESIYGQLKYAPVIWFALACPLALRRRRGADAGDLGAVLGMLGLAWLGPGILDLCFDSSAIRYTIDFLPCLLLISAIGAMALDERLRSRPGKSLVRSAWLIAALASAGVAAIISIPLYGSIIQHRGNAYYERVARILNLPAFWYERARDWRYGPITWHAAFSPQPPGTMEKLAEAPDASLLVEYLPGGRLRPGLKFADGEEVLWGDACPFAPGEIHTLSAAYGSLYPATEHPYYLKHAYFALARSTIAVTWDNRLVLDGFRPLGPVDCEEIRVAGGSPRERWSELPPTRWFSGRILDVARNKFAVPDLTPRFTPRTLRLTLPRSPRAGRWPLVSAGAPGQGDLLFLETESASTARFGYFSAGSFLRFSPRFALAAGSSLECTVQMEQFAPSGRTPGPPRPLVIEINGRVAWLDTVPWHPCAPGAIHLGENEVAPAITAAIYPGAIAWTGTQPRLSPVATTDHLMLRVVFPTQPRFGVREPILITGIPGASDSINVIHYDGGFGRFVLDHSGALNQEGPTVGGLDSHALHDIEIVTPVFRLHREARRPARGTIIVRLDGAEVLRFESDLYPAPPAGAIVGANEIGGPGESRFLGAILSQRWVEGSETNVAQMRKL